MTDSAVQRCPLHVVCPVVFVPGIMGSRLRNARTKEIVWQPGIANWDQRWHTLDLAMSGAAAKRRMLVGPPGRQFSSNYLEVAHTRDGWRSDRGYAGLLDTYLPFVNSMNTEDITRIDGCTVMIRYVVWAYPYNWTDSNLTSARGLPAVIAAANGDAISLASRTGRQAIKPLLITHSMGGLVARAYTQQLGGADAVIGVIHGAMPTHGSPELYKRIRGGFEGATSWVLGSNQAEVTATAANMPGALQLAPNRVYRDVPGGRRWLRALNGRGDVIESWPRQDPYTEIYADATAWYRLIRRDLLDPGGREAQAWAAYLRLLSRARSFHVALESDGFHPNTRMFYGTGRQTRDKVSWDPLSRVIERYPLEPEATLSSGRTNLHGFHPVRGQAGGRTYTATLEMRGPNAPGDGTVQAGSGIHVPEMSVAVDDGFEHQGAFDSQQARRLTRAWAREMVAEVVS